MRDLRNFFVTSSKSIYFPATLILLAGCTPASFEKMATSQSTPQLEDTYHSLQPSTCPNNIYCQDVSKTLHARNVIPTTDWPLIDAQTVAIGMGPDAVITAWGLPTDVNTETTGQGQTVQWVYRLCDTCKASYIYFKNNAVSDIQN
jgi:hypothetical protein